MNIVCLLFYVLAIDGLEGKSQLESRFVQEFPAAAARNEQFYSQMSGFAKTYRYRKLPDSIKDLTWIEGVAPSSPDRVVASSDGMAGRRILVEERAFEFATDRKLRKVIFQKPSVHRRVLMKPSSAAAEIVDDPKTLSKTALCMNADSSFEVEWIGGSVSPVLKNLSKGADKTIGVQMSFLNVVVLPAPYALGTNPQNSYPNPKFILKGITPIEKGGVKLAHIEFEYKLSGEEKVGPKANPIVSGWFDARPDQNWAIQEYQFSTLKIANVRNVRVDYEGEQGGFPMPKRVTQTLFGDVEIIEFDSIRQGPTPDGEFTLTAFGLPAVSQAPQSGSPNRSAAWLIAAGVLLFVAAIGVKIYTGRSQSAA